MTTAVAFREHPLMLTLADAIHGDGFLAGITLSGRALMRQEDDGKWWMYGVRPAGMAESGKTVEEAFSRFRNRYKEILIDISQESPTYEAFKTEVERFFHDPDVDDEDARLWESALKAIRTGKLTPSEPFSALPRESPESKPTQITIERLDLAGKRFVPSDNVTDKYYLPKVA
jgi:predicted RNase H-like HicB family nuclease